MSKLTFSQAELARYSRQIVLDEVGILGQQKLKNARVLCIGLGGLGSPLLQYLTAAGVGTLGLVDNDSIDISNLQRQILYNEKQIALQKNHTAKKNCMQ